MSAKNDQTEERKGEGENEGRRREGGKEGRRRKEKEMKVEQ